MMRLSSVYAAILLVSLLILFIGLALVEPWAPRTRSGAVPQSDSSSQGLPEPPGGATCFIQFYLGSLAVTDGGDPYSPLESLGEKARRFRYEFSPFSHPPTSLLPYLPMAQLPFRDATRLHTLIAFLTVALCMWGWARLLAPHRHMAAMFMMALWICFSPSLHLLSVGQNSFFVLVAITAGAWALSRQPGMLVDVLGGLGMALAVVKPHIGLLPLAGITGLAFAQRRIRLLLFAGTVTVAWISIWSVLAPESWAYFASFLQRTPTTTWYSSTLDGRLREILRGTSAEPIVRTVTMLIWVLGVASAAVWAAFWGRREEAHIPEIIALLSGLSLALCPHVFPYDFILLLPLLAVCLISALQHQSRASWFVIAAWAGLSIAYLALKTLYEQESIFWWMPWAALMTTAAILLRDTLREDAATPS